MGRTEMEKPLLEEEYPSQEDIREHNDQTTDKKPGFSGRVIKFAKGPWGRGATALGIGGILLSAVACEPKAKAAEVRPVESPTENPAFTHKVVVGEVRKEEATPTPESTKEPTKEPPTPTIVIPTVATSPENTATSVSTATAKKAEATATPTTPPKAELPQEAQVLIKDINGLTALTPEQQKSLSASFEKNWNAADTENKKFGAYGILYSNLEALYNQTKNPALISEMEKIEESMANQWPQLYKRSADAGFFNLK